MHVTYNISYKDKIGRQVEYLHQDNEVMDGRISLLKHKTETLLKVYSLYRDDIS